MPVHSSAKNAHFSSAEAGRSRVHLGNPGHTEADAGWGRPLRGSGQVCLFFVRYVAGLQRKRAAVPWRGPTVCGQSSPGPIGRSPTCMWRRDSGNAVGHGLLRRAEGAGAHFCSPPGPKRSEASPSASPIFVGADSSDHRPAFTCKMVRQIRCCGAIEDLRARSPFSRRPERGAGTDHRTVFLSLRPMACCLNAEAGFLSISQGAPERFALGVARRTLPRSTRAAGAAGGRGPRGVPAFIAGERVGRKRPTPLPSWLAGGR